MRIIDLAVYGVKQANEPAISSGLNLTSPNLGTINGDFSKGLTGTPNTPPKSVDPGLLSNEPPKRKDAVGGAGAPALPRASGSRGLNTNASMVSNQGGSLGGPTVDARHAGSGRPFGPAVGPSNLTGMDMAVPGKIEGQSDQAFGQQTSNWAKASLPGSTAARPMGSNTWSEVEKRQDGGQREILMGGMGKDIAGKNTALSGSETSGAVIDRKAGGNATLQGSPYGSGSVTFGDKPSTGDPRLRQEIAGIKANQAPGSPQAQQFAQQQFDKNPGAFGRPDLQHMSGSPRAMEAYSKTFPVQNATPTPPKGSMASNGPVPVNPAAGFAPAPTNPAGPTQIAGTTKPATPAPAPVPPAKPAAPPVTVAAAPPSTPAAKPAQGPAAVGQIPKPTTI